MAASNRTVAGFTAQDAADAKQLSDFVVQVRGTVANGDILVWNSASMQTVAVVPNRLAVPAGGAAPTVAAGANNGTTPPAPTVAGSDAAGTVSFGSGATATAGAQVVVTFGTPYASAPVVVLGADDAAVAAGGPYVSGLSATGFTLSTNAALASSAAAGTYVASFIVVGS